MEGPKPVNLPSPWVRACPLVYRIFKYPQQSWHWLTLSFTFNTVFSNYIVIRLVCFINSFVGYLTAFGANHCLINAQLHEIRKIHTIITICDGMYNCMIIIQCKILCSYKLSTVPLSTKRSTSENASLIIWYNNTCWVASLTQNITINY